MSFVSRLRAAFGQPVPGVSSGLADVHRRRAYDAAARGRLTEDWAATTASADILIERDAALLRARMRDLVRNNSYAAKAVQVLVNNLVGTGIEPRAASKSKTRNRRVDELFAEWARRCDVTGLSHYHGLVSLAVRQMIEGGEVFALRRMMPGGSSLRVPLQIELREAEHLDASKLEERDSYRIDQGIEYDRSGRRVAYWLYDEHPGGRILSWRGSTISRRVPAEQVVHLFERQRLQSRGVPWGTPAMRDIRDMGDYRRAELVRKKTEASVVAILMAEDDGDATMAPRITDAHGQEVERFEPGLIAIARGGKDVKFNDPKAHGGIYEWTSVQAHDIASGFRIPYEYLTSDLKQVNFSSSRLGLNEFRRMIEQVQWQLVIPMLCDRIWEWFVEAAYIAGEIDVPQVPVEWQPPRFESVNPLQDVKADLEEVRAGFATTSQKIAARGYNPREVLEEQAAYLKEADAIGVGMDSDARKPLASSSGDTVAPRGPQDDTTTTAPDDDRD